MTFLGMLVSTGYLLGSNTARHFLFCAKREDVNLRKQNNTHKTNFTRKPKVLEVGAKRARRFKAS